MKQWIVWVMIAVLAALGGTVVLAQDTTGETPIGDVTGDSASFYGQTVTLRGVIGTFVGSNVFTLSDAGALTNTSVLVINNSGMPLPNSYVNGQEVIVTGRVHPSLSEVLNGSATRFPSYFDERGGMMSGTTGTTGMMDAATMDPAMMTTPDASGSTGGTTGAATMDPAMTTPGAAGTTTGSTGAAVAAQPTTAGATMDPAMMATPVGGGLVGTATIDPNMMATQGSGMTGAAGSATMDPAMMATPMTGMATMVPGGMMGTGMMGSMPFQEDLLAFAYGETLPDEYDVYTILELIDINQLTYPSDSQG